MKTALILAAAAAAITIAPTEHADPGCFDSSSPECGGHSWNGPLHQIDLISTLFGRTPVDVDVARREAG